MQFTSTFNLRLLTLTCFTALCLSGTALAQGIEGGRSGTSTADNPRLRGHDEQQASKPVPKTIVKVSDKDANFVSTAMAGGEEEVENGKMALKRSQSADVKKVASQMVQDHTKANGELLALAKKKGIGVTTGTIRAQNMSANGFDKTYLRTLEQGHKKTIAAFEKEAKSGGDPDLKAWAAKTLPTLKSHLAMVQDGLKQVK